MDVNEIQEIDYDIVENVKVALYRLWKSKIIVCLITMIGLLLAVIYVGIVGVHTSYYARASIFSAVYGSYQDSADGVKVMNTYAGLLGTAKVCDRAADSLTQYGIDSRKLQTMVSSGDIYLSGASSDSKSYSYRLTLVTFDSSSEYIVDITNAMANAFVDEINGLIGNSSLQVLNEASGYGSRESIDAKKMFVLFGAGAFLLACVAIFAKEFFSSRVYSITQCEQNRDRVLGVIPFDK